jgi:RNA polymerase sigma factor (TIGR02999 family)
MQSQLESPSSVPPDDGRGLATDELFGKVYSELRALAARQMERERKGHTLPPTAVVHEVYLRLAKQDKTSWSNRAQFLKVASRMIRRLLVDHARVRGARKRGGGASLSLDGSEPLGTANGDVDATSLDEALTALATLDERQAKVVELRYFGGLSIEETAEVLAVSAVTVKRDWALARAWLYRELTRADGA